MEVKKSMIELTVFLCRVCIHIYDILSLPFHILTDRPWKRWMKRRAVWARLSDETDPYSPYVRQVTYEHSTPLNKLSTMDQVFRDSVTRHGKKKCYGTRQVFREEEVKTSSGKVFKKLIMGDYQWLTYNDIDKRVDRVSKGLLSLGVQSKKPVVILAETRVEWMISAQACFRINIPVVTLYTTLGDDGIVHGINQTEVSHVITSADLLPKIEKIFDKLPRLTHIVYMEGLTEPSLENIPDRIKVLPFLQLEDSGREDEGLSYEPPVEDDRAILMYTSGSTGVPKAVVITNKNIVTSMKGLSDIVGPQNIRPDDVYIGYLPVAHVLELCCECFLSFLGIPVGFSSPQTLTNFSTAIKSGNKGDITVLQPTFLAAVPLMLDRIRKSILQLAGKEGSLSRRMFDFAVKYKIFWMLNGVETPLLDRFVMKTYHEFVGGKLRMVLCGGAPISPDTQNFIRACLNVQVLQGYGMTETAVSACVMDVDDFSTGRVGAPLSTCKIRLVDWDEGQYHVTDEPHSRGEIVVGGDSVSLGYYKNKEKTDECFKEDQGTRWFYTGDIGEVYPDGTFKIIDRKSDLVKLQFGEYVALGKIEAELKTCPLVENICVFGSSFHCYTVALIVPTRPNLIQLAKELGKDHLEFSDMCQDKEIAKVAMERLKAHGRKCNLFGSELPAKIKLCSEEWTPDSGLVTAAFKIRRKVIVEHYQEDIEAMYSMDERNGFIKGPAGSS